MMKDMMKEEINIEAEYKQLAATVLKASYEKAIKAGRAAETGIGNKLQDMAFKDVKGDIALLFNHDTYAHGGVVPAYASTALQLLDMYGDADDVAGMMATVCMNTITGLVMQNSVRGCILSHVVEQAAQAVADEIKAASYMQQAHHGNKMWFEKGLAQRSDREHKNELAAAFYKKDSKYTMPIIDPICLSKLISKCIDMCVAGSGFFSYSSIGDEKGKSNTSIAARQWLLDVWSKNIDLLTSNAYRYSPMVVAPKKWDGLAGCAYWGDTQMYTQFLRIDMHVSNTYMKEYIAKLNQIDLSYIYDAVNACQETPFIINKKVLNTALTILSNKGDMGGIPSTEPLPQLPPLAEPYTEKELKQHKFKKGQIYKAEVAKESRLLRISTTLACAKRYSQYDAVYFPWNMDYRGRMYPMCSELNPQGDDMQKGLLLFKDPKPLTNAAALQWFYVAGAGYAGLDKIPFADRIKWVKDNSNQILSSAKDPINNHWWNDVAGDDSPMLFLSWCLEYARLVSYQQQHQGSCIGFTTGIVIPFDGTCSGLQHFSMLLADEVGGKAVNLVPQETVSDIYQLVADKINPVLKQDALTGTEDGYKIDKKGNKKLDSEGHPIIKYGTKALAVQWLTFAKVKYHTDGITRKVCKRSVMTLAYGSKKYGFAENLKTDIIKPWVQMHQDNPVFSLVGQSQAAQYLAGLIWDAVSTTVVKAVEGMKWLQDVASLITDKSNCVSWKTPNGLPIQQNKFKDNMKVYHMVFSGIKKRVYVHEEPTDIDSRKQTQSIAPNFIHSMDATHMQRVLHNQLDKGNTNFWMVHDCFGTDLEHADDMFHSIRQELVKMYKGHNYLQEFLEDVRPLIDEKAEIPPIPSKGSMDIDAVEMSKYCFA